MQELPSPFNDTSFQLNAIALKAEMSRLYRMIEVRFALYFKNECPYESIWEIPNEYSLEEDSAFISFLARHSLNEAEKLVILLALAPYVQPGILDIFYMWNTTYDKHFSEFGLGSPDKNGPFIPTAQTALFLLAGANLEDRFAFEYIFQADHTFAKEGILWLDAAPEHLPTYYGRLVLNPDLISTFTSGQVSPPDFSPNFPAKRIRTSLEWEDLVLPDYTLQQVREILDWLQYEDEILMDWNLNRLMRPGFKSLFYGPPGTGKTLTASLLGKATQKEVYRIDLAMVLSKWVGETEKNLSQVFKKAENQNWILFFDEAEALFGKRVHSSAGSSSNDRFANLGVSYLLQRMEYFEGTVILATNLKGNMDEAFTRRFQSMIYFPKPDAEKRLKLWKKAFAPPVELDADVQLDVLAENYELTGGEIVNVLRFAALTAFRQGNRKIKMRHILDSIKNELIKDSRVFEPIPYKKEKR